MDTFHAVIDSDVPLLKDLGFLADNLNIVENIRSVFRNLSNVFLRKIIFLKAFKNYRETSFVKYVFGKAFQFTKIDN